MILITGAGGKTGRAVLRALSQAGSVSAFVRRQEHVSALKVLGAQSVFVGDLRDRDAIRNAMQGARSIYHIPPNMSPDETGIGRLVIDEARTAGVQHFVYHSVLHPQTERMAHHWAKLRVEEMLFESGLPFTVLQPAPYMQNLLAGWKGIIERGILSVPYSVDAQFSFLDLDDLAQAARIVLTEPDHLNAIYELAGTRPTSHREAAQIISRALGREVLAREEDLEAWKSRTQGLSEYARENLVRMFEYYDQFGLMGNPNVLGWILKREPTSFALFLDRMLRA